MSDQVRPIATAAARRGSGAHEADSLVLTLARIIVAVERRRQRLVVIDGGKPMLREDRG